MYLIEAALCIWKWRLNKGETSMEPRTKSDWIDANMASHRGSLAEMGWDEERIATFLRGATEEEKLEQLRAIRAFYREVVLEEWIEDEKQAVLRMARISNEARWMECSVVYPYNNLRPSFVNLNIPARFQVVCKNPVLWMPKKTRIGDIKGPGVINIFLWPVEGGYRNGLHAKWSYCSPLDTFNPERPIDGTAEGRPDRQWDGRFCANRWTGLGLAKMIYPMAMGSHGRPRWVDRYHGYLRGVGESLESLGKKAMGKCGHIGVK